MLKETIKINPLLDHTNPWLCYKSNTNNLVYFSCNKCASTLYDLLFEKLEWKKITTADIEWDKDYVFSYIRNPVVRHRKGIVEGIVNFFPYMENIFINNQNNLRFLANITSIEGHSYTIHRMLGDNALKMHWIPIDTRLDHKQKTFNILKQHNEPVASDVVEWFTDIGKVNVSNSSELKLYNQLSTVPMPIEIKRHLDFDLCLYDHVVSSPPHEVAGVQYPMRIKQLVEQGCNQTQAEEIADSEVHDNTYLQWKFN